MLLMIFITADLSTTLPFGLLEAAKYWNMIPMRITQTENIYM